LKYSDNLDHRFKHKIKEKKPFYLWIKYSSSNIYYVKFKSGKAYSTKTTDLFKAYECAVKLQKTLDMSKLYPFHKVLNEYFEEGSKYLEYEIMHGLNNNEKSISERRSKCKTLSVLLSDVKYFNDIDKPRLIELQNQLLNKGLNGKTVNGYLGCLHKIYRYFIDNGIFEDDIFLGLRPCVNKKGIRLCFPMSDLKHIFSKVESNPMIDLVHIAIVSGMRKGEIMRMSSDDIIKKDYGYWLHINGTKTENAPREVPITEELVSVIKRFDTKILNDRFFAKSVLSLAEYLGYDKSYIKDNGIVFHSFRKVYKTLLTSNNINKDLIEEAIGHSQPTYSMNSVDKSYLCLEMADRKKEHTLFIDSLKYFY
jgi:site-specific recombinase XerD